MNSRVTKFDIKRIPKDSRFKESLGELFFKTNNLIYEEKIKIHSEEFFISNDNNSFIAKYNISKHDESYVGVNIVMYGSYDIGYIGFLDGVYSKINKCQVAINYGEEYLVPLHIANEDRLIRNFRTALNRSLNNYGDAVEYSEKLIAKSFTDKDSLGSIILNLKESNIIDKKVMKMINKEFSISSTIYPYEDLCLLTIYSKIAFIFNKYEFQEMFTKLNLLDDYFTSDIINKYLYRMRLSKMIDPFDIMMDHNFYYDKEKVQIYYTAGVIYGMIIKYSGKTMICIGERNDQYIFRKLTMRKFDVENYNRELFLRKEKIDSVFKLEIKDDVYEAIKLSDDEIIQINTYLYDRFLETFSYNVEADKKNFKLTIDDKGVIIIPKQEILKINI